MRAILLVALAAFLFTGIVRAADNPDLIGSNIRTEDAILKSRAVFVGQLVSLGERDNSIDHFSSGPEYPGAKVKVAELLKGVFDDRTTIGIYPTVFKLNEETPQEGKSYIFFVKYNGSESISPYVVFKLLPATDDNIATVKKLISN